MNAADKEQLKQLSRQQRRRREGILDDWKAVLSTPPGRRLIAWMLGELQPRREAAEVNEAMLRYYAALHHFGDRLKDAIDAADPSAYIRMLQEQRLQDEQETSEREALRIGKPKPKEPDTEE